MIYRARSYAPYRARRRNNLPPDSANARCACRNGNTPCPRHAPNLYTLWGGRHRMEVAS